MLSVPHKGRSTGDINSPYLSIIKYIVTPHQNCLTKMILMGIKTCFIGKQEKLSHWDDSEAGRGREGDHNMFSSRKKKIFLRILLKSHLIWSGTDLPHLHTYLCE